MIQPETPEIRTVPKAPFLEEEAINYYVEKYRRTDLPPLEMSKLLDLFPHQALPTEFERELTWADPWPFGSRAGVYLIYDATMKLIYVGKSSVIGGRLSSYFGVGTECVLRQEWGIAPRFLRVAAVPADMHFEAPALEAFLISSLQPELNTHGRY